jgi:general secretion pathway protein N
MRTLAVAAAAILALIGAAVAFAPAALLDARVHAASDGQVRLAGSEGTLWRGRSTAVVGDGVARIPVAWQLDPRSLATGEVRITLDPPADSAGAPRGHIVLAADRLRMEQLALRLPAAAIAAHIPVPGLRAGGEFELRTEDLAIAGTVERGTLRVDWRGARLALPGQPTLDLGTVTAALSTREGALAGPLTARGGTIRIDGDATLGPGGVRLVVRFVPEAVAGAAERAVLAQLGTPAADGSVSIDVARTLRR